MFNKKKRYGIQEKTRALPEIDKEYGHHAIKYGHLARLISELREEISKHETELQEHMDRLRELNKEGVRAQQEENKKKLVDAAKTQTTPVEVK